MISISIDLVSPPHNLFIGDAVWTKYTVSYSSLSAASNLSSVTLAALPAKTALHAVVVKHSASFTGTGITAYAVAVGTSANPTKFTPYFDVLQAPGNDIGQSIDTGCNIEDFGASTNIVLSAASMGGLLNAATAGSVDIYLFTSVLP